MERKFSFAPDEFYHIYNRGVDKRVIFTSPADYERFIKLLFFSNSDRPFEYEEVRETPFKLYDRGELQTAIGAYCLMPNHFHLLLKETTEGGITKFMSKLSTAYSMYFNRRHKRSGALLQGAFKAEHADEDNYLEYLYSYIHLNPVKLIEPKWKEEGIVDLQNAKNFLDNYSHSSYIDYVGEGRSEGSIISSEEFPEYFRDKVEFKNFVNSWLDYKDEFGGGESSS